MKKLLLVLMFVPLVSFGQDFKVVRVIDGDTFIIEGGERVRMIGIDAPELKDLYGVESKNQLKALIQNKHAKPSSIIFKFISVESIYTYLRSLLK